MSSQHCACSKFGFVPHLDDSGRNNLLSFNHHNSSAPSPNVLIIGEYLTTDDLYTTRFQILALCQIWTTHDVIIHYRSITITLQPLLRMFSYLVRTWGQTTPTAGVFGCRRCVKFGESWNDNLLSFNHHNSSATSPNVLKHGELVRRDDLYTTLFSNFHIVKNLDHPRWYNSFSLNHHNSSATTPNVLILGEDMRTDELYTTRFHFWHVQNLDHSRCYNSF